MPIYGMTVVYFAIKEMRMKPKDILPCMPLQGWHTIIMLENGPGSPDCPLHSTKSTAMIMSIALHDMH